eukprot:TRINITY_DN12270_c0_g1_i1.p1 TRINITY_DN12270_c0_g1~~TRINITY_DN12270_c0_g1_i1.p1  ORF type:complete len:630 (+),score=156.62 TRINITY_DN12270_c0_g1_i1:76-1965(+)
MATADADFLAVAPSPSRPAAPSAPALQAAAPAAARSLEPGGCLWVLVVSQTVGSVLLNAWAEGSDDPPHPAEATKLAELICAFQTFFRHPERCRMRLTASVSAVIANGPGCSVAICGSIADAAEPALRLKARHVCDVVTRLYGGRLTLLAHEEEHHEEKFSTSKEIIAERVLAGDPRLPPGAAPFTDLSGYVSAVLADDTLSMVGHVAKAAAVPGAVSCMLWGVHEHQSGAAAAPVLNQSTSLAHPTSPGYAAPDVLPGKVLLSAGPPGQPDVARDCCPSSQYWSECRALFAAGSGALWPLVTRLASAAAGSATIAAAAGSGAPVHVTELEGRKGGRLRVAARGVRLPSERQRPTAIVLVYDPAAAPDQTPGGPPPSAAPLRAPVVRCATRECSALGALSDSDSTVRAFAALARGLDAAIGVGHLPQHDADALLAALTAAGSDASLIAAAAAAAARAPSPRTAAAKRRETPPAAAAAAPAAPPAAPANPLTAGARAQSAPDLRVGDTVTLAPGARSWGVLAGGAVGRVTGQRQARWKVEVGSDHDFYMGSHLVPMRSAAPAAAAPAPAPAPTFKDGTEVALDPGARRWGVLAADKPGVVTGVRGTRIRVAVGNEHDFYMASHLRPAGKA